MILAAVALLVIIAVVLQYRRTVKKSGKGTSRDDLSYAAPAEQQPLLHQQEGQESASFSAVDWSAYDQPTYLRRVARIAH